MGIKTKLEHFKEGCNCYVKIDLFNWRKRFDVGFYDEEIAWESCYAFISFGPLSFGLSIGHFVEE